MSTLKISYSLKSFSVRRSFSFSIDFTIDLLKSCGSSFSLSGVNFEEKNGIDQIRDEYKDFLVCWGEGGPNINEAKFEIISVTSKPAVDK